MWDIPVGKVLPRRELHARFHGNHQRGIAPCAKNPNILLFTYSSGRLYGYDDGWRDDGAFHYAGEGQEDDQEFTGGNRAVRDHRQNGRALRLFEGAGGATVRYLGEYEVDELDPTYRTEAPDRNGDLRSMIVFRLRPVDGEGTIVVPPDPTIPAVVDLALESHLIETFMVSPAVNEIKRERREADLVSRYARWLRADGHQVIRKQINLPGAVGALYTDLFDVTAGELVEAKGSASRYHVRLGLGQVLDYSRYLHPDHQAVLLPVRPNDELVGLLTDNNVACVYPDASRGFARDNPTAA